MPDCSESFCVHRIFLGLHTHRQRHAQPTLDELRAWLDKSLPQVPPTSATGKALSRLQIGWERFLHYTGQL